MSRLHHWALKTPQKSALIDLDSGRAMSFQTLDQRVQRAALWLRHQGLQSADGILLLLENRTEIIELGLAARRAGLYFTPSSTHLTLPELAHIAQDCGAKILFVSAQTAHVVQALLHIEGLAHLKVVCVGPDGLPGLIHYESALLEVDASEVMPLYPLGRDMLYSSGTTGFPKGIRRTLVAAEIRDQPESEVLNWQRSFGFDDQTVYLSPAPLYHAAPLRYVMRTVEGGGCAILMKKFDAERALNAIGQYGVTHSQWVPTMFIRMLELPASVREQASLKTMRVAIHAAAPCPIHVKQALLDWWGDIVHEYYAGSEGFGVTAINSENWRTHPGSVGRATLGVIHIVGEDGEELPVGEIGKIYFSGGPAFEYWNDPVKTKDAYNAKGWATYGDMGYIDAEGYLYMADRRTDLILSGGVNVYPQEIENALSQHPLIQDVAVVGVPDDVFGQVPKAVVQLHDHGQASEKLAREIIEFCATHLSKVKMPRSVVFEEALPRLETGKLLRRVLKERYQADPQAGYLIK
ncbi:MAG: AMP-binding protein [Sheuella sp.]|nr:AMP-binding protein [Sheuella sp.]